MTDVWQRYLYQLATYIKHKHRQLPKTKSASDVDRGLDIGADMKTAVL